MKKYIVFILTLAMTVSLFSVLPFEASAADVKYLELDLANGSLLIEEDGFSQGILEKVGYEGNYLIKYTGGGPNGIKFEGTKCSVILDNVAILTDRPAIVAAHESDVNLILRGANSVKYADITKTGTAIGITGDSKLTINAENVTDSLDVVGGAYGAGIGSIQDCKEVTAQIVINGGVLNIVTGNDKAGESAGIGGARNSGAQITINGGNITTEGVRNGPGIGAGRESPAGSTVTINGGVINAKGNTNANGIGGGFRSACEKITINGGVINARSSHNGKIEGIGPGVDMAQGDCRIVINGGSVNSMYKDGEEACEIHAESPDGKVLKLTNVTLPQPSDYIFADGKAMMLDGTHKAGLNTFHFYFAEGTEHNLAVGNSEINVKAGETVNAGDWKMLAQPVNKPDLPSVEKDNIIVIKPEDLTPPEEETTPVAETTPEETTTEELTNPETTTVKPDDKTTPKKEKGGCGSAEHFVSLTCAGLVLLVGVCGFIKKKRD